MITRLLLTAVMILACPGVVSADYMVCNGNSCRVVRTPVRNMARSTVNWVSPRVTSYSSAPVVRTYRRGLFGRRVFTGYASASTTGYGSSGSYQAYSSPQVVSYGSSGSYQAYNQPEVSYGSSGSYDSYREVATPPVISDQNPPTATNTTADCGCNGECNCPCCPCKPAATKPDNLNLKLSTKTLHIPKFQLATKKLHVPDLRLASR